VRLLVTLAGLTPGAPLLGAVALADALDARRVPLTLLVGPRPHPEVADWTRARRRVGDALLLHGTRADPARGTPYRRLPEHEASLRLAGALRSAEALGLDVDGFAAPGWAASPGVRRARAAAGLDLGVDEDGVHRLDGRGVAAAACRGRVRSVTGRRAWSQAARSRTATPHVRRGTGRPAEDGLVHLAVLARGLPAPTEDPTDVLDAVDAALAAGAIPASAASLRAPVPRGREPRHLGDPESWSITT